ncbi:MAG: sulfatase [Acidimicrobiales bacterium]
MRRRLVLLLAMVGVVALGLPACSRDDGSRATPATGGAVGRPNVVVIMTDDQTYEEMRVMERTNRLLGAGGTTFTTFQASFPLCCPARATYLTGQYSQNNGVRDNVPPLGGAKKLKADETLPVWLQRAGYYTASVGKYLNGWGEDGNIAPPPGWDHWFGLIDPTTYKYFGYSVSVDGQRRDYGDAEADYQTDVLGAEVVRTIGDAAASGKPFFVSFTPLAPHLPSGEGAGLDLASTQLPTAVPAPRYADRFADEPLPTSPATNQADVSRSPDFVRSRPLLLGPTLHANRTAYRRELATLLAVDEWVGRIADELRSAGVADDTVVMFTSDNGLFRGEHRIPNGKVYLYEEATHMPLLVAGPGFPAGAVVDRPTAQVDLASTIVGLTGASPGLALDGADLAAMARDPSLGASRGVLLDNQTAFGRSTSNGIHTGRYVYLEHSTGERELYDLRLDPAELVNRVGDPSYRIIQTQLAQRVGRLKQCAGASCEGSVASGGKSPPAPPDPDPSQASAPEPPALPVKRPPALSTEQQATALAKAIAGPLKLSDAEQACLSRDLASQPDLVQQDSVNLVQDPERLARLVAVVKGCASPEGLERGLLALQSIFFGDLVTREQETCLASTMAQLATDDLSLVLRVLYDATAAADPALLGRAQAAVQGCGVDLDRVLHAP